jgi:glycosyltransferase involved in cell wall biosynthesis
MTAVSRAAVPLLAFVGWNDRDLLAQFLKHYRRLGVASFHFALHGEWEGPPLAWLEQERDVTITAHTHEPFSETLKCRHLNAMAEPFLGRWILSHDVDEFLELPLASLRRTIDCLRVLGSTNLPALVVQRQAAGGVLPEIRHDGDVQTLLPFYNFTLAEDMGVPTPVGKLVFPLALVTPAFRFVQGRHFPLNPQAGLLAPIRAVVHHFKWRATFPQALMLPRRAEPNEQEQRAYRAWLQRHHGKLPTEGALPCSTAELRSKGLLARPDARQRRLAALLRKTRTAKGAAQTSAIARRLVTLPRCYESSTPCVDGVAEELTDPRNLLLEPGRIALVGFEFSGPDPCEGIATALSALAEVLRSAGHEVHLLYCPFNGSPTLWHGWHEYWQARGIALHYLPRWARHPLAWPSFRDFSTAVADALQALDVDLIHTVDADAYGAVAALRRAAGRGFAHTQILTTMHGCMSWHRRGNGLRRTWDERENMEGLGHLLRHSDAVCYPSNYMRRWVEQNLPPVTGSAIVVPNCLPGVIRSAGTDWQATRQIDEIVFFGRLERRKGLGLFATTVRKLVADLGPKFTVTLLGKPGEGVGQRDLDTLFEGMGCKVRYRTNYGNLEAVNYLKTRPCVAVVPSIQDNSPYTVFECLDAGIPLLSAAVGGIPELVHPDDRDRTLVADRVATLEEALASALVKGIRPARLAFDPALAEVEQLAIHAKLVDRARQSRVRGHPYARLNANSEKLIRSEAAFLARPSLLRRGARLLGRIAYGVVNRL